MTCQNLKFIISIDYSISLILFTHLILLDPHLCQEVITAKFSHLFRFQDVCSLHSDAAFIQFHSFNKHLLSIYYVSELTLN